MSSTTMQPRDSLEHRVTAFPLVGPKSPEEKDAILREPIRALAGRCETVEEVQA